MSTRLAMLFVLCACKRDAPETTEPARDEKAVEGSIACPAGTLQRGAAPPDGYRVWCENHAGISHGPFRAWYPSGAKKSEGAFENGDAEGEWASWYDNGTLRSRGRYVQGEAVGEWERFDRDGNKAEPEAEAVVVDPPKPDEPPALTGIPACDLYIDRYSKCIEAKAPDATKAAMRDAFVKTVEAWKEAAHGPGRDALEQGCKAAYEAVAKTAAAWGCEF